MILTRRRFITGLSGILAASQAPAIVRAGILMPVRSRVGFTIPANATAFWFHNWPGEPDGWTWNDAATGDSLCQLNIPPGYYKGETLGLRAFWGKVYDADDTDWSKLYDE